MKPEDSPADEAYERDLLLHEIRLLTRVREAAKEIGDAIQRVKPILDGTGDANFLNVVIRAGACRSLLAALADCGKGE